MGIFAAIVALAVMPACDADNGYLHSYDAVCVDVATNSVAVGVTDIGTMQGYSIPAYLRQIAAGE